MQSRPPRWLCVRLCPFVCRSVGLHKKILKWNKQKRIKVVAEPPYWGPHSTYCAQWEGLREADLFVDTFRPSLWPPPPNNADIKGTVCILPPDKLLSTAAQTRNDYLQEPHTERQTGSQKKPQQWSSQVINRHVRWLGLQKTNSKSINAPLSRKAGARKNKPTLARSITSTLSADTELQK